MSEKRYYVNAKEPFRDGTAYVERCDGHRVCVSRKGIRSGGCRWCSNDQGFVDSGVWEQITEDEAKSLVRVSATLSERNGDE